MKTKQLKFLSLLTLILAFSCSVDELQNDANLDAEVVSEKKVSDDEASKSDFNTQQRNSNQQPANNTQNSETPLPGGDTEVYFLYLDMEIVEDRYNDDPNNPPYTGPFNIHYRNLMATHFSIYLITESTTCENIERWIVDLEEYNAYRVSIGLSPVDNDPGGDNNTDGTNTSSGTNNTTVADTNGKKNKNVPPPPPPDPDEPHLTISYGQCFN
ncbi:hypothetical protein [Winogradskyella tangerina]|uniref:hypothetical protein n=1 Tax=Winogradskyella tangerina TaxID=2023240 RepID=UPI000DBE6B65|nr:hypothetical protein [Winogradskyella tangerina]